MTPRRKSLLRWAALVTFLGGWALTMTPACRWLCPTWIGILIYFVAPVLLLASFPSRPKDGGS